MIPLQKLDSIKFFISIFVDIDFLLQGPKEDGHRIFTTASLTTASSESLDLSFVI